MRREILCTLVLLGLPQLALAEGGTGNPAPIVPGGELAADGTGTAEASPRRGLARGIDPRRLPDGQEPQSAAPGRESDWADSDAELDAVDRGLSFGLEIKPRSRMGALARQDDTEDPSFGDRLERILEQPVLELRGRYRF